MGVALAVLMSVMLSEASGLSGRQQIASSRFEAASIRGCDPATVPAGRAGRGIGAPAQGDGNKAAASPERLFLHCATASLLIELAYFGRTLPNPQITGGPAWIAVERFDVEAVAPPGTTQAEMRGPMLRSFLKEHLQLKTHRETRPEPIYALRAAKNGFKLTPLPEDICSQPSAFPKQPRCGGIRLLEGPDERVVDATGFSVLAFADLIESYVPLDRPLVDQTSISGRFDFHIRIGTDGPLDQLVAAALERQVGLKLDAIRGPTDVLIIDHVEKPPA